MRVPVLIMTLFLGGGPAQAGEAPAIAGPCLDCHNPEITARYTDVPVIAGLPEIVIANALYDFRGGTRPCRRPACAEAGDCPDRNMCEVARPMSAAEMDLLARYFAGMPFRPAVMDTDPERAALGREIHDKYCEDCHSDGGSNPLDEASILKGQGRDYIRNAMRDYRQGLRLGEDVMLRRFHPLSEEQLEALAHFYASAAEAGEE